jgi:hypothetical protein
MLKQSYSAQKITTILRAFAIDQPKSAFWTIGENNVVDTTDIGSATTSANRHDLDDIGARLGITIDVDTRYGDHVATWRQQGRLDRSRIADPNVADVDAAVVYCGDVDEVFGQIYRRAVDVVGRHFVVGGARHRVWLVVSHDHVERAHGYRLTVNTNAIHKDK